ncbi:MULTISPECIES: hydrolase [Bacillus]|uniref:Hydrolase n=1 Tax=Bacillus pumilus TaxID=1408 RepID=A0A2G8IQ11_BACPU|nr:MULTISPECIES: hydrolase [Bacillus]MED1748603.1 hydrolase [Bacillus zhangzhouensis]PIK25571.1 hydrolase [Bacillus pumilus]
MVNRKDRLTDKEYKIISDHAGDIDNYQQHHTIEIGQQTLTVHDFLKIDHKLYGLMMQQEHSDEFIVAFHCPLPNQMTVTSSQDVQTAAQSLLKTDYAYPIERKSLAGNQEHVFFKGKEYIEQICQKHPNVAIHLTGQALAGAVCAYIATEQPAVKKSVTFDSPNIWSSLPPSIQQKALQGKYTHVLTEYIQPTHYVGLLNRHDHGIGQVKYTVPPREQGSVQESIQYKQREIDTFLKSAFASMNIEWNESFDTNAFLALVSGDTKPNGYLFHPNGTARILDEQLDHNTSFTAMLLQEIHSGRAYAQSGLEIIIKSHLLKNSSYDLQSIIEHEVQTVFEKIDGIDESVKEAVHHVKQELKGLVGFGHYDLLSHTDVEALLEEVRMEQHHSSFYSHEKQLNALYTLRDYEQELSTLSRHLYTMGDDYAKADRRLALQMGIH